MKEPIALLINDIHISKDNIPEFKKNWKEMLDICAKEEIYDIVIGGDLWTSRAGQTLDTLLAVRNAIILATTCYGLSLTIAEGNHDLVDQEEFEGYSHIFSEYPLVKVVNVFDIMTWEDCKNVLVPMSYFPEDGTFIKRLDELDEELEKRNISTDNVTLYLHQGIAGGIPGGFVAPTDLDPALFKDYKQVLVGHYHNRVKIPDTNIEYIGSSRQHSFGEDVNKGYTIFYDDGSAHFVQNEVNTRYINIERDFKDLDTIPDYTDPLYKVKLKVTCTETEAKLVDKEKLHEKGINRIEIVQTKKQTSATQSSINDKYDADTIRKEYIDFCNKEDIDSTLGVEYLSKIK